MKETSCVRVCQNSYASRAQWRISPCPRSAVPRHLGFGGERSHGYLLLYTLFMHLRLLLLLLLQTQTSTQRNPRNPNLNASEAPLLLYLELCLQRHHGHAVRTISNVLTRIATSRSIGQRAYRSTFAPTRTIESSNVKQKDVTRTSSVAVT